MCTIEKDIYRKQIKKFSYNCKREMKQYNIRVVSEDESIGFGQINQRE